MLFIFAELFDIESMLKTTGKDSGILKRMLENDKDVWKLYT